MSNDAMTTYELDPEITKVETASVAVLNRSEVEAQLDAARRHPRKPKRFLNKAIGLATYNREIAESCMYAVPRGGKTITGPSVRLAEICASAYGNLHVGSRVLDAEEKEVVAQGVAWDVEENVRYSVEARRRITNKYGKRYDDDMITVTGAAASSVALRNAIFRVIPRAMVDIVYAEARRVAVGDAMTLSTRREEVVTRLQKMGAPRERILARVDAKGLEDIGLEQLETLIGLGTAVKSKDQTLDEAFPPVDTAPARAKSLEDKLSAKTASKAEPQVERDPLTNEVVPPEAS